MKKLLALIVCIAGVRAAVAQQVSERKTAIIDNVYEIYQVTVDSTTNTATKAGTYTAYQRKKVIANGNYKNGKRVGTWHFYNRDGKEMQQYDFDSNKLLFEASEPAVPFIRYLMDYTITDKDKVTKPVIIGGRYFGYLPYIKLMRKIPALRDLDPDQHLVVLKLQISPLGRLADCSVDLQYKATSQSATYYINTDLLAESDKVFIPGTYNGQAVPSRIEVLCQPDDAGEINILQMK